MDSSTRIEQFNRAFSRYGSRLDTTNNAFINDIRLKCQQIISDYSTKDIYFDIVDNANVNAGAKKFEGSYFIGMFRGTIDVFAFLARKFAAHPKILHDFGNPSKEINTNKVYNAIIKNSNSIIEEEPPARPITEERNRLCELIFQQSILNILFHEIAHIINGHVDLMQLSGITGLQEMEAEKLNLTPILSLDSQTLEIDADGFSAQQTLFDILSVFETNNSPYKTILPNYRSVFKLWSFVRFMCWRVMENSYVGERLITLTHPPTGVRQHFTRIACLDLVRGRGADALEEYEISFVLGVSDVDDAFRFLSEIDPVSSQLSKKESSLQITHGAILFGHWDTMREKLMKFTTNDLRAPNIWGNDPHEIKKMYNHFLEKIGY
jgi:hypothetical protein